MATRPLPKTLHRLLIASMTLSSAAFLMAIIHIGVFKLLKAPIGAYSLLMIPLAWLFTIIHHVTLFIISKRQYGPPPIPSSPMISIPVNQSRTSVYRPASSHASAPSSMGFINNPTMEERHAPLRGSWPSYATSLVNCMTILALVLFWSAGAWSTVVTAIQLAKGQYRLKEHPTVEVALSALEGVFGYSEVILMCILFSWVANKRWPRLQTIEKGVYTDGMMVHGHARIFMIVYFQNYRLLALLYPFMYTAFYLFFAILTQYDGEL